MSRIAINRPGAIGDIIMISNCFPKLREQYDRVDLFCHPSIKEILGEFLRNNELVNEVYDSDDLRLHTNNCDRVVNCVGYPLNEGYPEVKMRKHLIDYFADELGVRDCFDDLLLQLPPHHAGMIRPYITIQTKTGWSVYKEWWGWQSLVDKIKLEKPELGIYQIGGPNDPPLVNIDDSFLGQSFDDNLAAQVWGEVHLGLDSVFNHTSNIIWQGLGKKNCVILFGSTQHDASGYRHNTNISLEMPCQPCFREDPSVSQMSRGVCPHPAGQSYENPKHECMANITVDMVYEAAVKVLDRERVLY